MQRIFPLFLVFVILVGSVGVTVNRHFCMGEIKSLVLFGNAEACAMDMAGNNAPACPKHASDVKKKGCCDDEHEFVKWDDDRQVSELQALPPLPALIVPAVLLPPVRPPLHPRSAALRRYENYRPPPRLIDVPSHWQVFRL